MTAHDDLRRQLLDSTAERAGRRYAGRGRRRLRGPRGALAVVLLAIAVGGGVATAATQLLRGPSDEARARSLVHRATGETSMLRACRNPAARFVDAPALAPIERVFPSRATPATPELQALVRPYTLGGAPVLARSVRLVTFPSGERLLVHVTLGAGLANRAKPLACARAQRARLDALHPAHDAVHELAVQLLEGRRNKRPQGRQTLWITDLGGKGARRSTGTGIAVPVAGALPEKVVLEGSSGYAGIAAAGATTVRLATTPGSPHPVRRTIAVRERLFAFALPPRTGPVRVRQRAADGTTLAEQTLRR